jgi:YCII-related domain
MTNYVLLYKGGGVPATEEEQRRVMNAWTSWYGQLGQAVVDGGNPFGPSRSLAADGRASDGAASGMTGYTILQADTLDAATELARGCPILADGGTVEVYETFQAM